jgi:hypothetical protein
LIKGVSSLDPKEPINVESAMDIATINLPAYLYNPDDAIITLVDNRRYTMRDIGKLDDRISNLEIVTSLTLLELDTKTLQIQDADGLSRFKSGFFVDDFKNNNLLDILNPDCKCDVDTTNQELNTPLDFYSLKPELSLLPSINTDTADFSANLELLDSNVRKTGDLITLDYDEVEYMVEFYSGFFTPHLNSNDEIEINIGLCLRENMDIKKENMKKMYIEKGVSYRPNGFGVTIPKVLRKEDLDIIKCFDVSNYSFYGVDPEQEKQKEYYSTNGVYKERGRWYIPKKFENELDAINDAFDNKIDMEFYSRHKEHINFI